MSIRQGYRDARQTGCTLVALMLPATACRYAQRVNAAANGAEALLRKLRPAGSAVGPEHRLRAALILLQLPEDGTRSRQLSSQPRSSALQPVAKPYCISPNSLG